VNKCPKCGENIENAGEANFCSHCRAPLGVENADVGADGNPGARSAGSPEPSGDDFEDQLDAARTIHRDDQKAEAQFVQAVKQTISDGILDAEDESLLREEQDRLRLSDDRAAELKDEAVLSVISPPEEETARSEQAPIRLEMNVNHFTVQDYMCVLEFRLDNVCDSHIDRVALLVKGSRIGKPEERLLSLSSKECRNIMIQIEPEKAGVNLVEVMLSCRVNGEVSKWSVRHRLKVFEKTDTPSHIVINGPTFNARDNAKMGYGMIVDAQPTKDIVEGLIKTVNDLLKKDYPPMWRTLRLHKEWEDASFVVEPLAIDRSSGGRVVDQNASLVFGAGQVSRRVLLLGLTHIRMGRRRENDLVLRCFPRSKGNDMLSLQIQGGPHAVLSLRREGLILSSRDTLNGTMLNGATVEGRATVPLDRPSEVDVAKAMRLRITPFLTDSKDSGRCALLGQPDDLWRISENHGLRSVLIQRVDNLAGEEEYLIVYRWAEIGSGLGNELQIPDGQLKNKHIRLTRTGGRFWAESFVDGGLIAGEIDVGRGQACPLVMDTNLNIAGTIVKIAPFEQHGLA